MAIKKVLLSKQISGVIYDIFPKTSADVVVYGESTVAAALAEFATGLANVYTKSESDAAIKASADALYNKIMGITEEEGSTVAEAYDTLKEVAAWIDEHGEVAAAFTTDIAALKTAVGDENSGLVKAMADAQAAIESNDEDIEELQTAVDNLEAAVGDANSGLVKQVADLETAVDTLETVVGNVSSGTGLAYDVSQLQGEIPRIDGEFEKVNTSLGTHYTYISKNIDDIADINVVLNGDGINGPGLVADVEEVRATVYGDGGEGNTGLLGAVGALDSRVGDVELRVSGNDGLILDLQTAVGDENSGLIKQVADLEDNMTVVEESETNGNVKVNGEEVTVYTHPETHAATMIVEDDDHMFVTKAEKATIAGAAAVKVVSSQSEITTENDLYMVELA